MTKKDYVAIARVLDTVRRCNYLHKVEPFREGMETAVRDVAEHLSDIMARDNPRFDRARFLAACGVGEQS